MGRILKVIVGYVMEQVHHCLYSTNTFSEEAFLEILPL